MINVKVDTTEIEQLISEIKGFDPLDDEMVIDAICKRGVEILMTIAYRTEYKFSFGEDIVKSFKYEVLNNRTGYLINDNPHMAFVEFGTGVVGQGTSQADTNALGWVYNTKENGWWYPVASKPPEGQPSWFNNGKWYAWTRGQEAKNIFYNATLQLKSEIPSIIARVLQEKNGRNK